MALHLIKLCVGADSVESLESWIAECKAGRDTLDHTTRMFPRRKDEILPGGSLYWVIRGMVLWRYLEAADAPPDMPKREAGSGLSEKMRRELAELGLL